MAKALQSRATCIHIKIVFASWYDRASLDMEVGSGKGSYPGCCSMSHACILFGAWGLELGAWKEKRDLGRMVRMDGEESRAT